jgi:hypothetical protein
VAAVGAAGDGAEYAVMAGIVARDAADCGAFQAAFCRGGGCGGCERGDGEDGGEGFHDGGLRKDVAGITAVARCGSPLTAVIARLDRATQYSALL